MSIETTAESWISFIINLYFQSDVKHTNKNVDLTPRGEIIALKMVSF
jgi:hypothetical protein